MSEIGHVSESSLALSRPATLFRDGLHLVLAFLTLEETATAARACRHWAAAVATEPPKRAAYFWPDWTILSSRRTWRFLQRHATAVIGLHALEPSDFTETMTLLTQALPSLTRLEMTFSQRLRSSEVAALRPIVWPMSLRTLRLNVWKVHVDDVVVTDILDSFALSVHPLPLTDLHLEWRLGHLSNADLTPLLHLRSTLQKLTLSSEFAREGAGWVTLSLSQVDILKQLGAVRELHINSWVWSTLNLDRLVEAPSPIVTSLTALQVQFHPTQIYKWSSLLCRLPRLTRLRPMVTVMPNLPSQVNEYLKVMPHLSSIGIVIKDIEMFDSLKQFTLPTSSLRHLTDFELIVTTRIFIPEPHLTAVLLHTMPLLRRLSLIGVDLPSLACLAHMTQLAILCFDLRLRTVDYQNAEEIPVLDYEEIEGYIADLRRLPSLTDLRVRSFGGWVEGPDDSDCLEQLRGAARSPDWPNLQRVRVVLPESLTEWAEPLM